MSANWLVMICQLSQVGRSIVQCKFVCLADHSGFFGKIAARSFRVLKLSRQDRSAILGKILPIFHSFSAYFPPMVPHPIPHVYGFPYFHLFLPIICLKWYTILVINSNIVPICCFLHTCLLILPIFRLTFRPISAGPVCRDVAKTGKFLLKGPRSVGK